MKRECVSNKQLLHREKPIHYSTRLDRRMRSAPFFANGSKGAHSAELSAGRTLLVFQIRSEKKEVDTESCAD
jgi:hypothetical protein